MVGHSSSREQLIDVPGDQAARRPRPRPAPFTLRTIPSTDAAFEAHVQAVVGRLEDPDPEALQERLRGLFPFALVRPRDLAGEPQAIWYVYREGRWLPPEPPGWWRDPTLPTLRLDLDGWISEASPAAAEFLAVELPSLTGRHFTDFVVPGSLGDSELLFRTLLEVGHVSSTLAMVDAERRVRAFQAFARVDGGRIVAVLRPVPLGPVDPGRLPPAELPRLELHPPHDAAFADLASELARRMSDPTAEGLERRLRRTWPHATVLAADDAWIVTRDGPDGRPAGSPDGWWDDARLPRVVWDREALIVEANEAAATHLGVPGRLVGRHWYDLVAPANLEDAHRLVRSALDRDFLRSTALRRPDGTSASHEYVTRREGHLFVTVMRPLGGPSQDA